MTTITRHFRAAVAIVFVGLVLCGVASASAVSYHFTVNTTSISGQPGWLDFQFNPGTLGSQAATATVSNFSGATLDTGTEQLTGNVTGTLPGPLAFDNGTPYNDYFQSLTFGNSLTFDLHLAGPALTAPDGSSLSGSLLALSLFDSSVSNALLTNSPDGDLLRVDVNLDGTTALTTYDADGNGTPSAVHVPEPAGLGLLATGALALLAFRKRVA